MADLSLLNQVLEATLAFMILLLAMSVAAIVRLGPTAPPATESNVDTETAAPQPIRVLAGPQPGPGPAVTSAPPPALWATPMPPGMQPAATPPARRSGWLGRARYEARHVRGRIPNPRPPTPAGPPWGPAAPPPGRQPQSSERWT